MVPSGISYRDIHGRSVDQYQPEWSETVRGWRAAWAVVHDACTERTETHKHQDADGRWFLDLGGAVVKARSMAAARMERLKAAAKLIKAAQRAARNGDTWDANRHEQAAIAALMESRRSDR